MCHAEPDSAGGVAGTEERRGRNRHMNSTAIRKWAAAALVAAGVVGALGSGAASAQADRRFKGSATGTVTDASTPGTLVIDYVGNATHLGRFTRREVLQFTSATTFQGT